MKSPSLVLIKNEFRPLPPTPRKQAEIIISERDMAIYRHVQLKLDYQRTHVERLAETMIKRPGKLVTILTWIATGGTPVLGWMKGGVK